MTPREAFERMKRGENIGNKMDAGQATVAKAILRRQAGELAKEKCVEKIAFTPESMEPWVAEIMFGEGDLSEDAQLTLAKMRQNAHRVEMVAGDDTTQIMFYVYTTEADGE